MHWYLIKCYKNSMIKIENTNSQAYIIYLYIYVSIYTIYHTRRINPLVRSILQKHGAKLNTKKD